MRDLTCIQQSAESSQQHPHVSAQLTSPTPTPLCTALKTAIDARGSSFRLLGHLKDDSVGLCAFRDRFSRLYSLTAHVLIA